jgi:hypothetical protein
MAAVARGRRDASAQLRRIRYVGGVWVTMSDHQPSLFVRADLMVDRAFRSAIRRELDVVIAQVA